MEQDDWSVCFVWPDNVGLWRAVCPVWTRPHDDPVLNVAAPSFEVDE